MVSILFLPLATCSSVNFYAFYQVDFIYFYFELAHGKKKQKKKQKNLQSSKQDDTQMYTQLGGDMNFVTQLLGAGPSTSASRSVIACHQTVS